VELAGAAADPGQEASDGAVGLVGPEVDEVHDLIAGILGSAKNGMIASCLYCS
jgi:hypothetical protein